ncbi:glycosyltransferase family 2 protein [Paenibacillus rubinfantis]|uniref:glycosyltransferase family 2 protein n=1 Tax=Paenibacillus rubinfantis TaxID=1720296 RepID=UPI000AF7F546|nr:glycosyltransferase family 2 protein [Paenibacillus rubinfantis]
MIKANVQVLLSTYNGEKYLNEQLESILAQDVVDLGLLIRDDGSTDHTIDSLWKYYEKHPEKIKVIEGDNLGVTSSFFELIKESSDDYDFFAFCDQDDVWERTKLSRAISLLNDESQEIPLLYCSSTSMVDESLKFLGSWPSSPRRPVNIYNSLVENIAVGCTIVMNRKAMQLVKSSLPPNISNVTMHDWWSYLCVGAFGKVVFDNNSYILYRQHKNNVLGGQTEGTFERWSERLNRFISGENKYVISKQAYEFLQCFYHLLNPVQIQQIERFLAGQHKNIVYRFFDVLITPFYRQKRIDNVVLKILYVTRRI